MEEAVFARYSRSPVREAIFSVAFATPLLVEDLYRFCTSDLIRSKYGIAEPEGEPNEKGEALGYAVYNEKRTTILRVTSTQIRYHQLGDYPGWEAASTAFIVAWENLKAQVATASKESASIRYINEFDLVLPSEGQLTVSEYLNLIPRLPENFPGSVGPFFLQVQTLDDSRTLHGSVTEVSEVITDERFGISILLDVRVQEIEQEEDGISIEDFLISGRRFKNLLFESCITDATRAIFK